MATKNQTNPLQNFAPRFLPWLLAAAVFGIYALTLNHWVSLFNYLAVAKLAGWTWQPEIYNPLFFTVTAPLRWLPAAQIPIALNLFSALCAAVTLGLLARSVAILPQDPVLYAGSLRYNLDPFAAYGDATIAACVRRAGLAGQLARK